MIARSQGKCEICGNQGFSEYGWRGVQAKPCIDHDGPLWAVRGLLCVGCNNGLRSCNIFRPEALTYLANSWWAQQCEVNRLPTSAQNEPPVGSAIRNQWDIVFVHSDNGWHAPKQRSGRAPQSMDWKSLYDLCGPQNLVRYDLRAALADGSVPENVCFTVENCDGWRGARAALGVPEPTRRKAQLWQARNELPWLKTPEQTARALRDFLTPGQCLRVAELLSQRVEVSA